MPEMTISEAAQWAGKDRSTLIKAIQKGRISARRTDDGQWMIDPAELARVYQPVKQPVNVTDEFTEGIPQQALAGELAAMRQIIALLERQVEDVRSERDHWRTHAEAQTRLLTHMNETASEPAQRAWWQRLTGKG
jgi:Helix-turn-helix domain